MNKPSDINIARLLIRIHSNYKLAGKFENKLFKELSIQLDRFIFNKSYDKTSSDLDDLKNEILAEIIILMQKENSVFSECSEETPDNEKRIQAYITKIHSEKASKNIDSLLRDETVHLQSAIKQELNNLEAEGKIKSKVKSRENIYQKTEGDFQRYDLTDMVFPFTSLRKHRESRKNSAIIDRKLLRDLLESIINIPENYCFSFSDIMGIIINNTDMALSKYIYLDQPLTQESDEDNSINYTLPDDSEDHLSKLERNNLAEILVKRFVKANPDPYKRRIYAAMLFFRLTNALGFVEISEMLESVFGLKISKSTVEARIKDSLLKIITNDIEEQASSDLSEVLSDFVRMLSVECKLDEYLGDN